jgi:hypothetical protein
MQVFDKSKLRRAITAWPELGINYWSINKNATTTFMHHFGQLAGFNLPEKALEGHKAKLEAKKQGRYINEETALSNGLKNFCVVRDPLQRYLSTYAMFKFPKNKLQEQAAAKLGFNPEWDANIFLDKIEWKWRRNKAGNKHYWKQVWTLPDDVTKIDFILKLEDLQTSWPLDLPAPNFVGNASSCPQIINVDADYVKLLYKEDYDTFNY